MDCNVNLLNSLVSFYSCSKSLVGCACIVFDRYPQKTVVTINCMLSGFVKNSLFGAALDLFNRVLSYDFSLGLKLNYVTLVVLISGCVDSDEFNVGRALHSYCYKARYAGVGDCRRAFSLFREMKAGDFGFDKVSLISLILAACNSRDLGMGKMIHGYMTANGTKITVDIRTTLINFYSIKTLPIPNTCTHPRFLIPNPLSSETHCPETINYIRQNTHPI
ncbi:hypothetical protein ACFX2G_015209 [Malus domestica]